MRKTLVYTMALVLALAAAPLLGLSAFAADAEIRIDFAYQISVGTAVVAVADKGGFFAREGLDVRGRIFSSGPLINEALASGTAQFGAMGDVPTILAVASGLPVKILAEVGGGERRQRLMIPNSSKAASFRDIKGARLGITKGTSGHGAFFRICAKLGLEPSSFTLVHLEPPDMPEALASGQVDAVLVWEPTPTVIEAKGLGRELMTLAGFGNSFPMSLVGSARFIKVHPDATAKVLKALAKAARFIVENPEEAAKMVSSASGLAPQLARKSMGFHYYTVRWIPATLESLKQTTEFLIDERLLRARPDWAVVVDPTFIP